MYSLFRFAGRTLFACSLPIQLIAESSQFTPLQGRAANSQFRPLSSSTLSPAVLAATGYFETTDGRSCNLTWITRRAFVTAAHCVDTTANGGIQTRFGGRQPIATIVHEAVANQRVVRSVAYDLAVVIFDGDVSTSTVRIAEGSLQQAVTIVSRKEGRLRQYASRITEIRAGQIDRPGQPEEPPALYETTHTDPLLGIGDSGAALFDQDGRLLGVLSGGDANSGIGPQFFALTLVNGGAVINRAMVAQTSAFAGFQPPTVAQPLAAAAPAPVPSQPYSPPSPSIQRTNPAPFPSTAVRPEVPAPRPPPPPPVIVQRSARQGECTYQRITGSGSLVPDFTMVAVTSTQAEAADFCRVTVCSGPRVLGPCRITQWYY